MAKHKKTKLRQPPRKTKPKTEELEDSQRHRQVSGQNSSPTIPFDAADRILLIGEGDFSFAKSVVEHHHCFDVTATCLDSKSDLFEKYKPQAEEHVQYLEEQGQTVLYDIDATKLDSIKALRKTGQYARILFNFPHVGGKSKDVNRQVRFNQELLVKFFTSGSPLLEPGGTIVLTLFEGSHTPCGTCAILQGTPAWRCNGVSSFNQVSIRAIATPEHLAILMAEVDGEEKIGVKKLCFSEEGDTKLESKRPTTQETETER